LASEQLGHPDWRRGLETFVTRPLSLVAALILALLKQRKKYLLVWL